MIGKSILISPTALLFQGSTPLSSTISRINSISRFLSMVFTCFCCSFEIKCLSRKSPIKVGDNLYRWKDKPCPLKGKTVITIGKSRVSSFIELINVKKGAKC